jgi:hypothetical protein
LLVKLLATAVVREDEIESDLAPGWTLHGREVPKGAVVKLRGPRHANGEGGTLCGIPSGELVFLGRGFAPESPGACSLCQVELERRGEEAGPPPPYKFDAPPNTWMAEWEPEMVREWEKVWQRGDQWTIDLLLAVNRLWNLQDNLPRVRAALEEGGVHTPLLNASEIEVLARLGMAEFRRLTSSE